MIISKKWTKSERLAIIDLVVHSGFEAGETNSKVHKLATDSLVNLEYHRNEFENLIRNYCSEHESYTWKLLEIGLIYLMNSTFSNLK